MSKYFLFWFGEDGIGERTYETKEDLLEHLTPDGDGDTYHGYINDLNFIESFPEDRWDYTFGNFVIIKGDVVVPRPERVVTKLAID
jgi:hypothetical protein